MNKIRYQAQRGWYSLRKNLGLMSKLEYQIKKAAIKLQLQYDKAFDNLIVNHNLNWLRQNFDSYFTDNIETLPNKCLRLVEGLDEESCLTVQIALSRLMKLHTSGWRKMVFEATAQEALEIKRLKGELDSRIVHFPNANGGTWAYKDWLLPRGELEPMRTLQKIFMEELGGLQKIRGRDILDVGGWIGDTALVFQEYTDRKVYVFEPNPRNMEMILKTMRMNDSRKIVPVALGLGEREETLFMADTVASDTSFADKGLPVQVTTLDEWTKHNDADIGLIKVDIEGHEQKFLKGAVKTIQKHKPTLLLSIYHNGSDLFSIKPFIESLGLGYRVKIRRPINGGSIIEETMLICEAT